MHHCLKLDLLVSLATLLKMQNIGVKNTSRFSMISNVVRPVHSNNLMYENEPDLARAFDTVIDRPYVVLFHMLNLNRMEDSSRFVADMTSTVMHFK